MAQTGFTPLSLYYSATATNVPTAGNLVAGELAINTADGKLFYKDSAGVVQTIASKSAAALANSTTGSGATVLATSPTLTTPIVSTTIGVGGATPSVSGSGVSFPATQSASSDANTLDDYEEGTWTPTLVFSGGAGTLSYPTRVGTYTKIGRVVYLSMDLIVTKGTASGTLDSISGIPFNNSGTFSSGASIDGMTLLTGSPIWIVTGNTIYFYMTTTGNLGPINATNMGTTSVLRFAAYYNI